MYGTDITTMSAGATSYCYTCGVIIALCIDRSNRINQYVYFYFLSRQHFCIISKSILGSTVSHLMAVSSYPEWRQWSCTQACQINTLQWWVILEQHPVVVVVGFQFLAPVLTVSLFCIQYSNKVSTSASQETLGHIIQSNEPLLLNILQHGWSGYWFYSVLKCIFFPIAGKKRSSLHASQFAS